MAEGEGRVLLNNVDRNKSKYFERNYTRDLLARKLQCKIALPSHRLLVKIVEDKVQMLNFPLNWDDVRGAEDIWGKTWDTWKERPQDKKHHTSEGKILPLPITTLERYKTVTLAGDIMFINGIYFIDTIPGHIKFMTA